MRKPPAFFHFLLTGRTKQAVLLRLYAMLIVVITLSDLPAIHWLHEIVSSLVLYPVSLGLMALPFLFWAVPIRLALFVAVLFLAGSWLPLIEVARFEWRTSDTPDKAGHGDRLATSLLYANVFSENQSYEALAGQIREWHPDLVSVLELNPHPPYSTYSVCVKR